MKRTALARRARLRTRTPIRPGKPLRRKRRPDPLKVVGWKTLFPQGCLHPILEPAAPKRRKPINRRRSRPRRSPYPRDPARLAWLRGRPCRAPGLAPHPGQDPHHLRHDAAGNSLGAHVKDDSRAISLCRLCHGHIELGTGPWDGWTRDEIKAWENRQVALQAAEYEAQLEEP